MKVINSILFLLVAVPCAQPQSANQPPDLVVQTGHADLITSVAFTSDSRLIASGSYDNTIKIWDAASGVQLRTLAGHTKQVTSVAFSPDGKLLASGSFDYTARIWDVSTGKLLHTLNKHTMAVQSVAINRDGTILATSSIDKSIVLWNLTSAREIRTLLGHASNVSSVAFGPDGKTLASSSWDKSVKLWDTMTGEVTRSFSGGVALMSVAFSPNGRMVASAGSFATIKIWDVASGGELHTMSGGAEWAIPVVFSPDSKYLASGSNDVRGKTVKIWDVTTGIEIEASRSLTHAPRVFSLAFGPDGKTLAVGSDDNAVTIIDVTDFSTRLTLRGHAVAVNAVAFSRDGKAMAVAGKGSLIKLWDLQSQVPPRNLEGHSSDVTAIAFSPDNNLLASGSYDKTVRIWDLASGKSNSLAGHTGFVNCVAFSPDGKFVASASGDNSVKLWTVATGALRYTLSGHIDGIQMIAFSPNGKIIASASGDTTIKLWDVAGGVELRTLNGHSNWVQSVAFSPDGHTIASGSVDQSIKLWNSETGAEIRTLNGHSSVVQSVVFSPDGERLASGSWDRTIKIWDVTSRRETQTLIGHGDQVTSLSFYREGKILASASADAQTRLWDVASGTSLASLIALDQDDWAVVAPDGRFDASRDGKKLMHYVQGNQPIPLDSFFEQFYSPRLLAEVISREALRANSPRVDFSKAINRSGPLVKILSPKSGESFNVDGVRIVVQAVDVGGGIDEIRLYQNGRAISGGSRQLVQTDSNQRTFDVTLLPGTNEFRAIALNKDRTESRDPAEIKIELRAAEATADLYVIAVGLNEYKNSKYNLNYGAPDAQAFADAVEKRGKPIFRRIKKQVILSPSAGGAQNPVTKDAIETAFDLFRAEARPQDVFVFYYAGHGVMSDGGSDTPPQFYLVPYDVTKLYGNDEGLASRGISAELLKNLCMKINAQKQVIVLDACQAGGAIKSFGSRGAAEEKAIAQLNRSTGFYVLASTNSEQVAREFERLGHGVFTYALLRGLSGEADRSKSPTGKITVHQLVAYLDDTVPELTLEYVGTRQFPTNYASGQDFPLGVK